MLALQAKNLTIGAKIDGAVVPAIRDLSFDLASGKILGLVGESGAGKTMVGRAIAQLLPAGFAVTSGSLLFEGEDMVRMAPARRRALLGRAIAFIPQAPMTALNPVLTIGAQFDEHLSRLGEDGRKARRERALAMLDAARLPDAGDLLAQYPHQLSGGMCQRVLIALAFASNPRLVIADEPTTALDVTMHPPILRLIAEMQQRHGTAVIFITHDLRLAAQLCDDVIVMYAGRAIESGPARAVLSTPAHPYTRCLQLANPSMQRRPPRALCHARSDAEPAATSRHAGVPFRAALSAWRPTSAASSNRRQSLSRPAAQRPVSMLKRCTSIGTAAEAALAPQSPNGWFCRSKICRSEYEIGGGLFGGVPYRDRRKGRLVQHCGERIRRAGRRKRQRQEHDRQVAGRA